jgi:predicted restriction endonuclease
LQLSKYIKRYLVEKYGEKCCQCGWNKRHSVTGRVPLEANHINGNAEDNRESNLELLCPNCHSLTANFRFLNKGMGRACRRKRVREKSAVADS